LLTLAVSRDCFRYPSQQEHKGRDVLPLLGKRFVRESADKSGERRLALCDLSGNEYVTNANKKDLAKLLFDAQEGQSFCLSSVCFLSSFALALTLCSERVLLSCDEWQVFLPNYRSVLAWSTCLSSVASLARVRPSRFLRILSRACFAVCLISLLEPA
jgi:hypothetical protein